MVKLESSVNWYAVHTMPRAEKKVYERLEDAGIEAYLPLITVFRNWSDRKKKVITPLISSFVFVQIEEIGLNDLLKVQGVCGILKYLRKPAIIKKEEIENLKILLKNSDQISVIGDVEFVVGDEIEVVKGPFKGVVGQYVNINGKYRVIIGIEAIGNKIEVNIPMAFIIKRFK